MLDRILPFSFNASMAAYFAYSFLFPAATGFWLVKDGFAIILLEFFSFFIILALATGLNKDSGWEYSGPAPGTRSFWLMLAAVLAMAFLFSFVLGALVLFGYFLLSLGVKAYQLHHLPDAKAEGQQVAFAVLFFLLGAFAAVALSPWLASQFPDSVAALSAAFRQTGYDVEGDAVDNPGFIAIWGLLYFVGMALAGLFAYHLPAPSKPAAVADDDGFDMPKWLSDALKRIK